MRIVFVTELQVFGAGFQGKLKPFVGPRRMR
jgi:hypothetical protein